MADDSFLRTLHATASLADPTPDAELLRRYAASRDDVAFELLVRRHAGMVWRVCRGVLRADPGGAEDAFQAAFLALAQRAHTVRTPSAAAWLFRAARNAALQVHRRSAGRPTTSLPVDLPTLARAPDEVVARDELATILFEEVDQLSARFRTPIVLCYFAGYTHAEAAASLGWAIGTVASRVARARDQLRTRLSRRGVELSAVGLVATLSADPVLPAPSLLVQHCVALAIGRKAIPAPLSTLTRGVVSAMSNAIRKLAAIALGLGLVLAGVGIAAMRGSHNEASPAAPPARPADPQPVAVRAAEQPRPVADQYRRATGRQSLARIAQAMRMYAQQNGHLPTDITDKAGRPLLSWRVELLPYLNHMPVFKRFKLDEPWDSPANKAAANLLLTAYHDEDAKVGEYWGTRIHRLVGPGTLFEPGKKLALPEMMPDRWNRTLAVVAAGELTPWSKPADIPFDPKSPPDLSGRFSNVILAATLNVSRDGLSLRPDLKPGDVRKLATREGDFTPAEFEALNLTTSPGEREYEDAVGDLRAWVDTAIRLEKLKVDLADAKARKQGRVRHGDAAAEVARFNLDLVNSVQNLLGQLDQDPALKNHKPLRAEFLRIVIGVMTRSMARNPAGTKQFLEEAKKQLKELEGMK